MKYSKATITNDILILTDYTKNSGLGNYFRSKFIFSILKKKSLKVDFEIFSKFHNSTRKYDIIVLDLPNLKYNIAKIVKTFSKTNTKVISLDYNFKEKIDCNIALFLKNRFAIKNYVNLKYCIIRNEFHKLQSKKNDNIFFMSIGSSDINKKKTKLAKIFKKYYKDIYTSPNINNKNNYRKQKIFLKKMSSCDLAASNGGTTLLELLYFKKIVFVYPQNNLELKFAKFLKKKGFIIFINKYKISSNFILKLKNLIQKNNLIDSLGAERIVEIILKYQKC